MSEHVVAETKGGVLTIRLNRAEKKNALTVAMYAAWTAAMKAGERDPAVRVMVITGSGDSFAAGNDLKDFLENPPDKQDAPVFQFMDTLATFPKPVIAAVNGLAIGVGTTMLLHCDLAYAVPNAKFQCPFVSLGIVPEYASTLLVPRMVGQVRAADILLLGEAFTAEKAKDIGFINDVVPAEDLMKVVAAKAAILSAKPPGALRAAKALLRGDAKDVAARILQENDVVRGRLVSAEFKEAATAFFEKRAPDFSKFS